MRMNRMATAAFWLSTVALTALGPNMIARAFAADPLGTWYTEDHDSQVHISKCGGGVCGALVWLKDPQRREPDDRGPTTKTPMRRSATDLSSAWKSFSA